MIIRAPISSFPLTNLTTIGDMVDTASSNQTAENTVLQPLATYTDTHL